MDIPHKETIRYEIMQTAVRITGRLTQVTNGTHSENLTHSIPSVNPLAYYFL